MRKQLLLTLTDKKYILQIVIVRSLGQAIGMLKGLNANTETIKELENNLDYIVNEFTKDE